MVPRQRRYPCMRMIEAMPTICVVYANGYAALSVAAKQWLADHRAMTEAYVRGITDEFLAEVGRFQQ